MPHTFEEIVSAEIDGLYHGALFLSGGDEVLAVDLLVAAVSTAYGRFPAAGSDDPGRWLEGHLARSYLDTAPGHEAPAEPGGVEVRLPVTAPPPSARELCAAAASVPPVARAALWLVGLRRWRHGEAEALLGVDRGELRRLLLYRHALLQSAIRGSGGRNGIGGTLST